MTQDLDLTPAPRVLQVLGDITLEQWRCLAEFIDNSIDGFIDAARSGQPIDHPEIAISIPSADDESARISIKDNGPGMSLEVLEKALRAGWSGNDPLSKLGLFGMGFNIATARLGFVTEVWTSRKGDPEQVGVRIDLNELRASNSYRVPRQTRPKYDDQDHGTEIIISHLKPEQRTYFARSANKATVRRLLARTYSSLLSSSELGTIRLHVGGSRVLPLRPCVWDESRSVELPDGTIVRAVERFDVTLAPRRYCKYCMRPLTLHEEHCPTGSDHCEIVETPRRIKGWVGIQRYLDKSDYGIDLVRNGRKVEIGIKDLFLWTEGDGQEAEYPTDDPRGRGRFVGEIHMDHCQVNYTKNRFERDDPAWQEMVRIVRGDGPLRPTVAKQKGYQGNQSPLYRLYQAFRRTSPQGKNGLWSRLMIVHDNDRAQQMATMFANGEPDYQSDENWWKLVEEQDTKILGESTSGQTPSPTLPGGFLESGAHSSESSDNAGSGEPVRAIETPQPTHTRKQLFELTRKYVHPTYRVEFEVEAFSVDGSDSALPEGHPWIVHLDDIATRTYVCLVNLSHEMFRSTTMTPLDALLVDLSHRTIEYLRGQQREATLPSVFADFRKQYCVDTRLDGQEIIALAGNVLIDICRAATRLVGSSARQIYEELSTQEKERIAQKMANRGVSDLQSMIEDGRYWEYADGQTVRGLFRRRPELFLDNRFWEDPYGSLDFGAEHITNQARQSTVDRYDAYFNDVVWLAHQTPADVESASRDQVIRATCSLRLLKPDVVV